jgi:sugar lactone lactonase YvrE/DNA-binding IclR family transcriptional regulator
MTAIDKPDGDEEAEVPGTQALMRGIDVLMAVSMAPRPLRFGEIQTIVNIPKGTLHRLLAALVRRRLLRYEEHSRRYLTGSRVFDFARRTLDQSGVIRAAKPELSRLARQLGRPACLCVADGADVFVIDFEDPDASQTRVVRVWPREAAASTAAGKAIIGYLPSEAKERGAVPDVEIGLAQALGYAVLNAEAPGRPSGVASAICDGTGFPVAAISVTFEGSVTRPEELHAAGRLIAESARRAEGNANLGRGPETVAPRPAEGPHPDLRDLGTGRDFMGENPVWSARDGRLWWLDILAPALRWHDPATGATERRILPDLTGGLALARDGGLVLLGQNGVWAYDPATGDRSLLVDPEQDRPDNRFNTAAVDPGGALWAGTMDMRHRPGRGALYRVGTDLSVARHLVKVGMAKNVAFSPDARTLYFSDGARGSVLAYDKDTATGALSNERVFCEGGPDIGQPNGIACDAEGGIWAAMIDGWTVRRFLPDGTPDRVIVLPVPMPTGLTFGGPDLRTLFVTTTYLRLPPGYSAIAPQSGNVFAIDLDIAGQTANVFGGRE